MRPEIKCCGLTRHEDAAKAVRLGAAYLGFIFAPSPRRLTLEEGARLVGKLPSEAARRVGVFAGMAREDILRAVHVLRLDVAQLHEGGNPELARSIRAEAGIRVWNVVRVGDAGIDASEVERAAEECDGILLDARVDGALGGTGHAFDWEATTTALRGLRGHLPIILAGGLRPENVGRAIAILSPDVVDVSSGVEASPGIKDHARMRAFVDAVHGAGSR